MKIEAEELILKAKVVRGLTENQRYIRDELNSQCYPGMLQNYGVNWEVGDELEIVIRRVRKGESHASLHD